MTQTEDKITVTGKTYGLQLFLDSLGFVRYGEEMTATATVDRDAHAIMTDLRSLAETYGWQLARQRPFAKYGKPSLFITMTCQLKMMDIQ